MKLLVMVALVGTASSARADDCEKFVKKSRPVVDEMMKAVGQPYGTDEEKKSVEDCRKAHKDKSDPKLAANMKCVLSPKTKTTKAIQACWNKSYGLHLGEPKPPEPTEAAKTLDRLRKNLIVKFETTGGYPKGSVSQTPATKPCCLGKDHRCAAGGWTDPVWVDLEIELPGPTQFQYTYTSDGKTVTAMAAGDVECDDKLEIYTLKMSVKAGKPVATLTQPPIKKAPKK